MKVGIIPWPASGHVMNRWRYDVLIRSLPEFGHSAEYAREDGEYDCAITPLLPECDRSFRAWKRRPNFIIGDVTDELFSFPFERYSTLGKMGIFAGLLLRGNRRRLVKMVRGCDRVVVGCERQRAGVIKYNPNVAAITDAITDDILAHSARYEDGDKCRLAWIGNAASLHGLTVLGGLFDALEDLGGYELVLITSERQFYGKWLDKYPGVVKDFISWSGAFPRSVREFIGRQKIPCRFINWDYDSCAREAALCDVGIVPVNAESEWGRNKPAGRALYFMALGLPVVASPIGSHLEVLRPGVGFVAEKTADWLEVIQKLKGDAELRRSVGLKAKQFAKDGFGERQFAKKYASVIDGLQKSEARNRPDP